MIPDPLTELVRYHIATCLAMEYQFFWFWNKVNSRNEILKEVLVAKYKQGLEFLWRVRNMHKPFNGDIIISSFSDINCLAEVLWTVARLRIPIRPCVCVCVCVCVSVCLVQSYYSCTNWVIETREAISTYDPTCALPDTADWKSVHFIIYHT